MTRVRRFDRWLARRSVVRRAFGEWLALMALVYGVLAVAALSART